LPSLFVEDPVVEGFEATPVVACLLTPVVEGVGVVGVVGVIGVGGVGAGVVGVDGDPGTQ